MPSYIYSIFGGKDEASVLTHATIDLLQGTDSIVLGYMLHYAASATGDL